MKKVFTLLTLLVAMVTSAWADDEIIFSATANVDADVKISAWSSGDPVQLDLSSSATITPAGSSLYAISKKNSEQTIIKNQKSGDAFNFGTNDVALKITCTKALAAGDIITIVNPSNQVCFTTNTTRATTLATTSGSYTIPAEGTLVGVTTFYVWRVPSSGTTFTSIIVSRPPSAPAKDYTVTATTNNSNYGTAAAAASSLDEGETTEVTATPKSGYQFVSWAVEGTGATLSSTTTNPTTLTMGTANATVTATFSAINYTITHGAATGGTYTISVAGGAATDANTTATIGQTITLAGTPTDPAHTYIVWNVKDAGDNDVAVTSNQFTMPASNVTIAPVFSEPLNTLFSMTSITGPSGEVAASTTEAISATFAQGGSAEVYNGKSSAQTMLVSSHLSLNGSGNSYIHITLPNNVALQAGDVISAEGNDGSSGSISWKLGKTSSASDKACPYTLTASDALIGATELYIKKNSGAQISSVTIQGSGIVSDFALTSSATPTVAMGATSNITYTSSSTGAVTYTSDDESVATVSNTGVITGVDGGTATITISQDADETYRAVVAKVTVTVPAIAWFKIKTLGGTSTKVTGTMDNVATGVTADVNLSSNRKMDKTKYVGFTLNGVNALQTGDIIKVEITTAGQNGAFIFYDSKGDDPTVLYNTGVAASEAKVYSFVVPASMNGVKTVYLRRGADDSGINEGFNPVFGSIAVFRPDVVLTEEATSYTPVAASDVTVSLIRTLSASYYNTFCVPFDIDLNDTSSPLYGADVQELYGVDGTTLRFIEVTGTMGAGNPYLVKPAADVVNPIFTGVDVSAAEIAAAEVKNKSDQVFKFKGTYNKVTLATNRTEQFLNTSGSFSYPSDAEHATMKGLRAYFIIPAEVLVGGAPEITISFDGDEEDVTDDNTTVIDGIEYKTVKGGEFYNLNGQRVAQPTKGLYIVNGKKVIVK